MKSKVILLDNGNVLYNTGWGEERWEEKEPYTLVRLNARGGSPYPDGEWEFSGSYDIEIRTGDFGNVFCYTGYVQGDYNKIKRVDGRRIRGPKFEVRLVPKSDIHYGVTGEAILHRKGISIKKAKKLIVEAVRAYEATDRFKQEIWPQVLNPDARKPILKEIDGQLIWVATTWGSPWSAVQTKNEYNRYGGNALGYGHFFYRELQPKLTYPKTEDGYSDFSGQPTKNYEDPQYSHIEERGGSTYGGWDKRHDPEEMKKRIDEAIYDLNDLAQVYIAQLQFRSIDWGKSR
ncbi:hypothetical protein GZH47_33125 (plasmid) [Paenibacillus rhizovicinus]|uniref:Uncharacterized protein n=1 Tax=Paenibacillus rhizovicinus TaxID=2704463 RepID=A0A6C0PB23_9BACL|nr:hypothetical protein [Paenibacillus rhizovicinus]QHW35737.1 hypothetical protein GZH47_33125 [Paenibacillus rhizovicinus]